MAEFKHVATFGTNYVKYLCMCDLCKTRPNQFQAIVCNCPICKKGWGEEGVSSQGSNGRTFLKSELLISFKLNQNQVNSTQLGEA